MFCIHKTEQNSLSKKQSNNNLLLSDFFFKRINALNNVIEHRQDNGIYVCFCFLKKKIKEIWKSNAGGSASRKND